MTTTAVRPDYVYVASSWRNPFQQAVIHVLLAAGIAAYDFRNPEARTGFAWAEVKPPGIASITVCQHCSKPIKYGTSWDLRGLREPDIDPSLDPVTWRHMPSTYASCGNASSSAVPKSGSDWETAADYLAMLQHPRSVEGFGADFDAMQRADTFVLVLPCGKSAHLELGWAVGAGKRTAILLEDPVEPELMYRMVDHIAPSVHDLLGWLGVQD